MFSTVPCSSRTKPGYVQETSWLRFSQSEIILWIQACLSPICIEQVGFFNKHIFLKKKNQVAAYTSGVINLSWDLEETSHSQEVGIFSLATLSSFSTLPQSPTSLRSSRHPDQPSYRSWRKISVKRIFKTCKSTALSQLHSWTHYYQICMRTVCMEETSKAWILFLPFDFAPTWKPSTGS